MSQPDQPERSKRAFARSAQGVTLIGAGVDLVVGVLKLVTGVIVGSAALVADGIHSFSDIVTDAFVLAATHYGRQAPDRDHPYGHGRIETLATLWLGSVLIFVAGAIAWSSVERLLDHHASAAPGLVAIAVAVVSLLAKEAIYHYTLRAAYRLDSSLLEANAWHSRTDAMSTLVVLVGLVAGQFGVGWMDAVAAIVVGLLVGWVGGRLMWQSSRELIDTTALPVEEQRAMRRLAESVPGVQSVHDLRTRQLGSDVVLDLHIVVAPRVTVSEAHEIGNAVSRQLREAYSRLKDVTFHIDPEDDEGQTEHSLRPGLPLREEIEQMLEARWSHQRAWQHRTALNLHYLDDRIDISLYVDSDIHDGDLDQLAHQLCQDLDTLPWVGQLKLWQGPGKA